ncbi:MAG TPA: hypothetical protein VNQ80_12295 [Parapedobacter sp.]|uniref:hypothetical protein n=1 Tax=Parapedobacter sp. TaxID=1958893 RepID=UPI002BB13753|nr:hypothetical protein [Parapedobacter sp.]HWK58117.1 hypothetical protein [Parapedobacter sp.]
MATTKKAPAKSKSQKASKQTTHKRPENDTKQQKAADIDVTDIAATATVTATDSAPAGPADEASGEPAVVQETVHEQSSTGQSGTIEEQVITVLIPYLASAAAGGELKHALRTWEQNYQGDFRVVVVGEREDWFSDEITHLPIDVHMVDEDCGCDNPKKIRNPQADVAHKLLYAITSGTVNGQFILTNDDIFLLGPTTLSELQQPKILGNLTDINKKGMYGDNARRTSSMLKSAGKATLNYGTHTPMVLDSEKLADTIRGYKALDKGVLLTSAYFNHHQPEPRGLIKLNGALNGTILISVYSENPPLDVVQTALKRRKYLNCNTRGWKKISHIFEEAYPEKSRFEV